MSITSIGQFLQAQGIESAQGFGIPSLTLGPPRPFASAAANLMKHGLAVIPCGHNDGKKPSMKFAGRRPLGEVAINKIAARFPFANVAVLTHRSDITVVDIDADDRAFARDIERQIGRTPLAVRTPSGGCHLYYQSSGERNANLRRYDLPIDIKATAAGYVVAPPSIRPSTGRPYYFERGSWDLISSLPPCDLTKIIPSNNTRLECRAEVVIKPPEWQGSNKGDTFTE